MSRRPKLPTTAAPAAMLAKMSQTQYSARNREPATAITETDPLVAACEDIVRRVVAGECTPETAAAEADALCPLLGLLKLSRLVPTTQHQLHAAIAAAYGTE